MATFLSNPHAPGSRAMPGARHFGDRLCELLEDDYLCWYDVQVGPRHQHPDFLVLHPGRGLLILEASDELGERLNIKKTHLKAWRETFAAQLRRHGVAAIATPLAQRGESGKSPPLALIWRDRRAAEIPTTAAVPAVPQMNFKRTRNPRTS